MGLNLVTCEPGFMIHVTKRTNCTHERMKTNLLPYESYTNDCSLSNKLQKIMKVKSKKDVFSRSECKNFPFATFLLHSNCCHKLKKKIIMSLIKWKGLTEFLYYTMICIIFEEVAFLGLPSIHFSFIC